MKRRTLWPSGLERHFSFVFIVLIIPLFFRWLDSVLNLFSFSRYYCETGDVQGTLGKMPGYKVRETLVLRALHRHGTDMVCK